MKKKAYDEIIDTWLKADPENVADILILTEQNQKLKETRKNELASTDDKGMRWALSLPQGLAYVFMNQKPELFRDKKELHWFMKNYPQFCIANKN